MYTVTCFGGCEGWEWIITSADGASIGQSDSHKPFAKVGNAQRHAIRWARDNLQERHYLEVIESVAEERALHRELARAARRKLTRGKGGKAQR